MSKTIRRVMVAGLALIAATAITAQPATASLSQCYSGAVCLWGENNYTGAFKGMTRNAYDYRTIKWNYPYHAYSIHNGANSVRNQGNSCLVVLYAGLQHTGPAIMFNRVNQGINYQDPYLANGGGVGYNGRYASENWQNRISSHEWIC